MGRGNWARLTVAVAINDPSLLPINTEPWMKEGKCTTLDPHVVDSIFFVEKGADSKMAKTFCKDCPVKRECGQYVLTYPSELDGYWAGTTKAERRKLRAFLDIPIQETIIEIDITTAVFDLDDDFIFMGMSETAIEDHFSSLDSDY